MYNFAPSMLGIKDNTLVGPGIGDGLYCEGSDSRAMGNMISGFATPIEGCRDDGNSL
jgi:hypothetical protein